MSMLLLAAAILFGIVAWEEFGWSLKDWWGRHYSAREEGGSFSFAHIERRLRPACDAPPPGWVCSRGKGHPGPCAPLRNNDPCCPECGMVGFHKMSCDDLRENS